MRTKRQVFFPSILIEDHPFPWVLRVNWSVPWPMKGRHQDAAVAIHGGEKHVIEVRVGPGDVAPDIRSEGRAGSQTGPINLGVAQEAAGNRGSRIVLVIDHVEIVESAL